MNSNELTWEDVYKLPFQTLLSHYIYSSNGVMTFTFALNIDTNRELTDKFVDILNKKRKCKTAGHWKNEGCNIYFEDKLIGYVRGWGHLTGCGAMNLPIEEAKRIQDGLIEYVINCLNDKN